MQTLESFDVLGHTDTNDGTGPMTVVARFRSRDAALDYIRTPEYCGMWSVQGIPVNKLYENYLVVPSNLVIYDSVEELLQHNKEDLKQRALKKLSLQEREALGL